MHRVWTPRRAASITCLPGELWFIDRFADSRPQTHSPSPTPTLLNIRPVSTGSLRRDLFTLDCLSLEIYGNVVFMTIEVKTDRLLNHIIIYGFSLAFGAVIASLQSLRAVPRGFSLEFSWWTLVVFLL